MQNFGRDAPRECEVVSRPAGLIPGRCESIERGIPRFRVRFAPGMTTSNHTGKYALISGRKKIAMLIVNPMFHRIDRSRGRLPR